MFTRAGFCDKGFPVGFAPRPGEITEELMRKNVCASLLLIAFVLPSVSAAETVFRADSLKASVPAVRPLPAVRTAGGLSQEDAKEEAASLLSDFVGILIIGGWVWNNLFCTFGDYPYSPEASYVSFKIDTGKTYRFTLDSSLGYHHDAGITAQVSFRGYLYKFFGPYLELEGSTFPVNLGGTRAAEAGAPLFTDELADGTLSLHGKAKLGGIFSIFQAQGASLAWYLQWLRDLSPASGGESGFSVGLVFDSYPVKPLGLHLRADYQSLPDGKGMNQFDIQVGFLRSRWEFFLGYQLRSVFLEDSCVPEDTEADEACVAEEDDIFCGGLTFGARLHM